MGKKKNKVRTCGNCVHLLVTKENNIYSNKCYYCGRLDSLNFLSYYRPSIPVTFDCHKFKNELENG